MTPLQLKKEKLKTRKAIEREKKRVKKAAKLARKVARRERQAIKSAGRTSNLLAIWSREIRCDGGCAVCGSPAHLQAHHILPKERYPEFKYHPMNGVALCPEHHKFGRFSAHRNALWFVFWLRKYREPQYHWAKAHMGVWDKGDSTQWTATAPI